MRIRRPLLVTVVSVALAGATLVPSAHADSTVVVGRIADMAATDAGFLALFCNDPGSVSTTGVGEPGIQSGPAPIPLGARAWHYDGIVDGVGTGPYRQVATMEDLSYARLQVNPGSGAGTTGVFVAGVAGGSGQWIGVSPISVASGSGWTTQAIGTGDTLFSWKQYDSNGAATGQTANESILDLVSDKDLTSAPGYVGMAFGCDTHGFSIDDVQIGDSDDVVTYDLEAAATTFSMKSEDSSLVAGDRVKLTGVLRYADDGTPVNAAKVELQAKPAGATSWTTVGTATQDSTQVSKRVHPKVTTSYRWIRPETDALFGSHSSAVTVKVHTRIPVKASKTSVSLGTTVKVTGHTVPKKRGARVSLWRGNHQIDTARTDAHGRFRLVTKPTFRGIWKVYVTIAKSTGNLAGRSRTVRVRVG